MTHDENSLKFEVVEKGSRNESPNRNFQLTKEGVFFVEGESSPIWICDPLEIVAYTRNDRNENWGRLIRFQDKDHISKDWAMPMSLLAGDGSAYRTHLLDRGLTIASGKKARDLLGVYLQTEMPSESVRCVEQIGWHKEAYVFPDQVFGRIGGERLLFQNSLCNSTKLTVSGTLEDWKFHIANRCAGNSRLIFGVSAAFTAPLLSLTHDEGGGFHLRGNSSIGKTTALYAAGSVWGGGGKSGFLKSWRSTANGLEAIALAHNDGLLLLDEISQVDPAQLSEIAYMLANGSGKSRAGRNGEARRNGEWKLLFLSNGELSLSDCVNVVGVKTKAGQEIRIVDIAADANKGLGSFENVHEARNADEFATALRESSLRFYGTPIRKFLERLSDERDLAIRLTKDIQRRFILDNVPGNSSGEVVRVARRFGLVTAGGLLSIQYGVTDWSNEEVYWAVTTCFKNWLDGRGGTGNFEDSQALSKIRLFLQENGNSRFILVSDDGDATESDSKVYKRAGYRRKTEVGGTEWLIFPEVFKTEICKGLDFSSVTKLLVAYGHLKPGENGRRSKSVRLPGLPQQRMYVVSSSIMGSVSSVYGVTYSVEAGPAKDFDVRNSEPNVD